MWFDGFLDIVPVAFTSAFDFLETKHNIFSGLSCEIQRVERMSYQSYIVIFSSGQSCELLLQSDQWLSIVCNWLVITFPSCFVVF